MLSSRARYAVRAVLDLCLEPNGGTTLVSDIAHRQHIPLKFLQQILVALKAAGFVRSRKGPGGGYSLAMAPDAITLGAVVRAMDGRIMETSCIHATATNDCGCPDPARCAIREVMIRLHVASATILDATTFADLRDRHRATAEASAFDFVI